MIARHEAPQEKIDIWTALAAPLATSAIAWRQDGRAVQRDGRWMARYLAYVEANTVRERLDAVVPGEWDLTLDLLPPLASHDDDGHTCAFKARLQILGVIREDVGTGRDYKTAATDAFKRAAVRFGIANELYQLEPKWVPVEADDRHAKTIEQPPRAPERRATADGLDTNTQECPKCGGRMWDNRLTKRNPKAPDYKCRDRSCDGVIWPPRDGAAKSNGSAPMDEPMDIPFDSSPLGAAMDNEIPF